MNYKEYPKKIISALSKNFSFGQLLNRFKYEINTSSRKEICNYDPIWIQLYVTSRCNFRCNFCTNHSSEIGGKVNIGYHNIYEDMSFSTFKNIIKKFGNAMSCTFCGVGEPFLNKDLIGMIKHAKNKKMITEVVTNGSKFDHKLIDEILEAKLDRITISLNESDKMRHKELTNTREGVFDKIVENISHLVGKKRAKNSNLEIKICRVLSKNSLSYAEEFIKLGIKIGIERIIFHNSIYSVDDKSGNNECLFEDEENISFIKELRNKYEKKIDIEFPILIKKNFSNRCLWYWKNISIDSHGNVSGCGRFMVPKKEYGNIKNDMVWNNNHFSEMRRRFIKNNMLECCKSCIENSNN